MFNMFRNNKLFGSNKKPVELSLEPYQGELAGKSGWLAPDGKFFECEYRYHWLMSEKLCKKYGYAVNNKFLVPDSEYTLELNGWLKISKTHVFFRTCEKPITARQLNFLFDYYVANKLPLYEYETIMANYT